LANLVAYALLIGSFLNLALTRDEVETIKSGWKTFDLWLGKSGALSDLSAGYFLNNVGLLESYPSAYKSLLFENKNWKIIRVLWTSTGKGICKMETLNSLHLLEKSKPNLCFSTPYLKIDQVLQPLLVDSANLCQNFSARNIDLLQIGTRGGVKISRIESILTGVEVEKYAGKVEQQLRLPNNFENYSISLIDTFEEIMSRVLRLEVERTGLSVALGMVTSVRGKFNRLLLRPCEKFVLSNEESFRNAKSVSNCIKGKEHAYMSSRSARFKLLLFIWEFCNYVIDVDTNRSDTDKYLVSLEAKGPN